MRGLQLTFVHGWLLLIVFLSVSGANAFAGESLPTPDILILMPDQMRGDCMSALDHPAVQTPALDALAEQGVLFRRAYATVPSCIPARYAMLTGLFPQTSGVVGFRKKAITTPTMPEVLRDAGYKTILVGREMHQLAGPEALGYDTAVRGSTYITNDEYATELAQAVPEIKDVRQWVERDLGLSYNHWQATPWPLDESLHPTNWVVEKAREQVASAGADEQLCLTVSFYAPHPPLFPPKRYFDKYMQMELPTPARGDWVKWDAITPEGSDGGHRVLLKGETLQRAQAGYFGLIEHLDAQIAPLIAEFQERSDRNGRPWVILVTSDHGEMLGDHGYFRKCEPLEGSANIPMIIAGSPDLGFRPGRSHAPVCLEDILPTLAHLAGADCPDVDGISLTSVLKDENATIRDWLHFEHAPCYSRDQAFHAMTDGHFKYIWRPTDGREHLFDLDADPYEQRDLAISERAVNRELVQTWRAKMIQRLADRPEGFADGDRLVPGRPYARLNDGMPRH